MKKALNIIFHIDGDAFFASCEQATNMALRGKPIAVGRERGIATAYSYEAKALGVKRAMSTAEIAKKFPQVQMVSSDYRKYSFFSNRMKSIVMHHLPDIGGGGIDECFANATGVVASYNQAHSLALRIQQEVQEKLGLTVSVGVGSTKTISKIASGMNKPCGVTIITPATIKDMLYPLKVGRVSGIGWQSEPKLNKLGIYTIGDFAKQKESWVKEHMSKPYVELHQELNGHAVREVLEEDEAPKSISKIRAFTNATTNEDKLLSEFARNAEIIVSKMYKHSLQSNHISIGMKIKGGEYTSFQFKPAQPVASVQELIGLINENFNKIYKKNVLYRATYVGVGSLGPYSSQENLFESSAKKEDNNILAKITNVLEKRFGAGVVHTAQSLAARTKSSSVKTKNTESDKGTPLIYSVEGKRALFIPFLGEFK